jgi:rSAM/selenodomain-associated transferase 1
MRRIAVIVFAREPIPGQTKTRLAVALGAEKAAALADAFNRDALAKARRLRPAELVIAGTAKGGATRSVYFRRLAREFGAWLYDQGSGDLGARMARALRPFTNAGGAILFGTDTPSLPVRLLARNADLLDERPVVIAPTLDGGFYLVGVRARLPDIFKPMRWGSSEVLATMLSRLRERNEPYCLGPWWYDVDQPMDLDFLRAHLKSRRASMGGQSMPLGSPHPCPTTAALLKKMDSASG